MPVKTVSVEEFMDALNVIIKEIAALRADIKNLKFQMQQTNALRVSGGARV
ncbi:MAG: hypothetical protein BWY42_00947 [Candidatus Omnitrophica bacterium ADurb.Bin277]|jgi:hypothetical protein|nr:MAG: hypothetical protein BWY42_00947 [Candidatus Omnitrophica bacterium ADurb.Bin277]